MTEHLPECFETWQIVRKCNICDALRACEERVRRDEPQGFTPDENANNICEAFRLGLAAAREAHGRRTTDADHYPDSGRD